MTKPAPASAAAQSPWIEIFVAGRHTDANGTKVTFTEAHLDQIVASYDPKVHEAPIVVGHPKTDDPALGWVSALKREGKKLYCQEIDVAPEFEEMRAAGRYKKRSASFYLPTSPGNPTPGKMHLRHVGQLGAMPPAVKGMADKAKHAAFSDDDGVGVIEFNDIPADFSDDYRSIWAFRSLATLFDRLRDRVIETDGVEVADRIVPTYEIDSLREAGLRPEDKNGPIFGEGDERDVTDPNDPGAPNERTQAPPASSALVPNPTPEEEAAMTKTAQELTDAQAKLKEDQDALAQKQVEFGEQQKLLDEQKAAAKRGAAVEFADALIAGGQLAPSARASVVELLVTADAAPALSFSDEEGATPSEKPAGEVLRGILNGLPKQFDFSEKSGDRKDGLDVNDPNAIARAASDFSESERKAGREISMSAAVQHVTKGAK